MMVGLVWWSTCSDFLRGSCCLMEPEILN
ncbi:unnamed protein product, partial [Gulo gulo]